MVICRDDVMFDGEQQQIMDKYMENRVVFFFS